MQWKLATRDVVHASPAVVDRTVYVGSWDSYLYAIDAESGQQRWVFKSGEDDVNHNQVGFQSSPAVVDGPAEFELAPARSRRAQQRDCDRWLVDFNNVRPHQALGGKTPAEVYKPCHRAPAVRLPSYPPEYKVRRVNRLGAIKLYGDCVYVSLSLRGQLVGLRHESGLRWRAYFHEVDLGLIEIADINEALSVLSAPESIAVNPNEGTSKPTAVSA